MVAGGVFAVCVWFGWLFERWWRHALQLLGMSLRSKAPFPSLFLGGILHMFTRAHNGGRYVGPRKMRGCRAPTRVE
jgi:hypothetical protein